LVSASGRVRPSPASPADEETRSHNAAERKRACAIYTRRAPDITHAILDGRQPRDLTAEKLLEHSRLPLALARSADRARFCLSPIQTQKPFNH